jgi:hypothetical protein
MQQAGQNLQESGFAAAGRADDGEEFSITNREIDIFQSRDRSSCPSIDLGERTDDDDVALRRILGCQWLRQYFQRLLPVASVRARYRACAPSLRLWAPWPNGQRTDASSRVGRIVELARNDPLA